MNGPTPLRSGTSLIVTVRNDRRGIVELLDALARQTVMPDEIVLVDGGSDDGTLEEVERWDQHRAPLRVVVTPGVNIAGGRNIAVREARHDWILCTDAGCRPVQGWTSALKRVRAYADVAAGTYVVQAETPFETAMACACYPELAELDDPSALVRLSHRLFGRDFRAANASGRSMAFGRSAWEVIGGFPEDLYAGEDVGFSAAAAAKGLRSVLVEDATVLWRPRGTWSGNARMYATYARGDIRTPGRLRHLLRLGAWIGGPLLAARGGRFARTLVAAGAAGYIWLPLRRASRAGLRLGYWWLIPVLVALKDLSQLWGAAAGTLDAVKGVPQPTPSAPQASSEPHTARATSAQI
jgi:glycosyltransferase involved in cell wall biosynthesis